MHELTLSVRWSELDPYHHVNHAVYMNYMEAARIAALDSIGWGMERLQENGLMIIVAEARVRFRRPAGAGDMLTVRTTPFELRPASSRWRQEIHRDSVLLVSAELVGAMTDLKGRPRRMPAEFASALETLMEPQD